MKIPLEVFYWVEWLVIFLIGSCVGSFLNVCIYRMPLNKSVLYPGSHCAACGAPIAWRHNIPVLSWLLLKGRAACCGSRIDGRYALVEALTGLLFVGLWVSYSLELRLVYVVFLAGLIVATFVDIDHFIIPDEISLGGVVAGILASGIVPALHGTDSRFEAMGAAVFGALVGGGSLFIIAVGGSVLFRREAMGLGDVKLLAAMGAFLGWQSPLFIITASSLIGSIIGVILLMRKNKLFGVRMPFGPYLSIAALVWLFGGKQWTLEYLKLLHL